ncbi:hypothetical protein [Umezawaea sp. Da 62-37]|uniref:hypothetical protein n=1 Tax=Umezawaea sp. Da 62-37 TaxID=3075927 RepID=UPI0028F72A3A|nr:hypothetical protein [Umezawaea sp. Da 62-37]WNV84853.1 hypothetical protein RM788_42955 [Umezawaea sp. Da 62-37]
MGGFEPAVRNKITADSAQDRKAVHGYVIRPHGAQAQVLSDPIACLGFGTRDRTGLGSVELSGITR